MDRSSPDTQNVAAVCVAVSSTLRSVVPVPVPPPPVPQTTGLVPSSSVTAISQRSVACAATLLSSARALTRTAPDSVTASSLRVNHSTAVPPDVRVTCRGAVGPVAVLVTAVWTPAPRDVHASFSVALPGLIDSVAALFVG